MEKKAASSKQPAWMRGSASDQRRDSPRPGAAPIPPAARAAARAARAAPEARTDGAAKKPQVAARKRLERRTNGARRDGTRRRGEKNKACPPPCSDAKWLRNRDMRTGPPTERLAIPFTARTRTAPNSVHFSPLCAKVQDGAGLPPPLRRSGGCGHRAIGTYRPSHRSPGRCGADR